MLASHKTIRLGVPLLAVIYGCVEKKVGQISQTSRTSQSWELKGVPGRLWGQRVCWMAGTCQTAEAFSLHSSSALACLCMCLVEWTGSSILSIFQLFSPGHRGAFKYIFYSYLATSFLLVIWPLEGRIWQTGKSTKTLTTMIMISISWGGKLNDWGLKNIFYVVPLDFITHLRDQW